MQFIRKNCKIWNIALTKLFHKFKTYEAGKKVYKRNTTTEALRWFRLFKNNRKLQTLAKTQSISSSKSATARNVAFWKNKGSALTLIRNAKISTPNNRQYLLFSGSATSCTKKERSHFVCTIFLFKSILIEHKFGTKTDLRACLYCYFLGKK